MNVTPSDLIRTSLLLGAFVAAGGAYGILLSIGNAFHDGRWRRFALGAYAAQSAVAIAVAVVTPLDWWWKLLVLASDVAYYFVPPVTWRYLITLHQHAEESSS